MELSIPEDISIYKLIQNHVVEINELRKQCKLKRCKSSWQRIPRHMRRRAASNNPKRIPKKFQNEYIQSEINQKIKNKPKRKARERKIKKRNNDPKRTHLHIWFAKRFKLDFRWGLKIPYKNNMKNQRILYRSSKKGYTIFYLPFVKTYKLEALDEKEPISYLSKFCSENDFKKLIRCSSEKRSCTIYLYQYEQYPFDLIGPCHFFPIDNFYLISSHLIVLGELFNQFSNHFDQKLSWNELDLSNVQLYGPQSLKRLQTKLFGYKDSGDSLDNYKCLDIAKKKILEFKDFLSVYDDPNQTVIAYRKFTLNNIETINLLVPNRNIKMVWNSINRNMSHLVGGVRDLEVMTLDMDALFFPNIGYADCVFNRKNIYPIFSPRHYIIRNEMEINNLNLFSSTIIEEMEKIHENFNCALVVVIVDYLKRKSHGHDIIFAPKNMINTEIENIEKLADLIDETESPIGFIEYGCFSMKAAKCRAMGIISLRGLDKLIKSHKNILDLHKLKQLYAVSKSKFNHHNLIKLSLLTPNNLF